MELENEITEGKATGYIHGYTVFDKLVLLGHFVVAVLMALVNSAIVVAFLVQKLRRPVRVSLAGLLVLNLLVADAFCGAVIMVYALADFSTKVIVTPTWCSVGLGFWHLALSGSYSAVVNVVIDRYVAIRYTLHYRDRMTSSQTLVMVSTGWIISFAGAVTLSVIGYVNWRPKLVHCSNIDGVGTFLKYVLVPVHVVVNLYIVAIQCRVYLQLRYHDDAGNITSNKVQRFSNRSAKILFGIISPICFLVLFYDIMTIICTVWINPVILRVFHVSLLLAELSILINPVVYSYATANIRKPVSALWSDIKRGLMSIVNREVSRDSQNVSVIQLQLRCSQTSTTLKN